MYAARPIIASLVHSTDLDIHLLVPGKLTILEALPKLAQSASGSAT
jgi:hypothetical protein